MVPEVNLMGILHTKGSMVRGMCGVQLKDSKRSTDLMFMLGYEGIYGSVGYGKQCSLVWPCVKERGHGHVLGLALDFEIEGQRMKGRPNRTWKRQVD